MPRPSPHFSARHGGEQSSPGRRGSKTFSRDSQRISFSIVPPVPAPSCEATSCPASRPQHAGRLEPVGRAQPAGGHGAGTRAADRFPCLLDFVPHLPVRQQHEWRGAGTPWMPRVWPSATIRRSRSGDRSTASPSTKNVAWTPEARRMSRMAGVVSGEGPSSKVSATVVLLCRQAGQDGQPPGPAGDEDEEEIKAQRRGQEQSQRMRPRQRPARKPVSSQCEQAAPAPSAPR